MNLKFADIAQDPAICGRCGANWKLAVRQACYSEGYAVTMGTVQLRHCINVCKTLTEATFNKLKAEEQT